jgi:exosortase family protein XrtM
VFHFAYFSIPDLVFREILYYRGLGSVCSELIHWLAPLEGVSAVHNHVLSPRADLEIVRGCDGAGALFLIVAAILAFPANFKRKLLGLGVGVLLMYGLNLGRIVGLYFIIAYQRDWFDLVHTYLAPTLIIVLACLYFAWWAFGSSASNHVPP